MANMLVGIVTAILFVLRTPDYLFGEAYPIVM